MIDTLQHKPIIGIVGGFSGTIFAGIKAFLTDDAVLNGISVCGIWIGFFIALLTFVIKIVEVLRLLGGWTVQIKGWFKRIRKK